MKIKVVLGELFLGSFLLVGFCQASDRFDDSGDETGLPMMTPSPSLENLGEALLEDEFTLTSLRLNKVSTDKKRKIGKISPRTDAQVEAEEAAIKKAKGYGAIKKKHSTS
jgi:hypothetical protein